jgi:DNA-binding LytR/AlgR family response regulator
MIDRILIIEDEKLNSDRLLRFIDQLYPKAIVVGVLKSVAECIAWFTTNEQPSVVLMDVRLSDGLCFSIFEQVKVSCPIIFTTAYDEYALKAFKVNSVDYLLKPVDQDELKAAFAKIESQAATTQQLNLDGLLQALKPTEYRGRFLLPYKDGYKTIRIDDILYFYSELKITKAKLQDGKEETIPYTLEELEQQLNPKLFFRANRQFIVHIDAVIQLHNHFNGKLKVEIKKNPKIELVVSRDKANLFKAWLNF